MRFRKLGHCNQEELDHIRKLTVKLDVLSFMLEASIKHRNEAQMLITEIEAQRVKEEYEKYLDTIYAKTGNYPGGGRVKVLRSGDILEYFPAK